MSSEEQLGFSASSLKDLCRRFQARRLSMFGSALRGELSEDSDIDLLVEFEPGARVGLLTLSRMQRELSELWGRKVDLVPRTGLKKAIRDVVLAQARVLYET